MFHLLGKCLLYTLYYFLFLILNDKNLFQGGDNLYLFEICYPYIVLGTLYNLPTSFKFISEFIMEIFD